MSDSPDIESAFVIRNATEEDTAELRLLIELSVRALATGEYSPDVIEAALGHALGLDAQLIEDGTYFVASPEGRPAVIAGCGGWSYRRTLCGSDRLPNREHTRLVPESEPAKIRAIYVHPQWARRGLGSLILRHCENAAVRAGFRQFEMGSTLTGVPLYLRKGYQPRERMDIPLPNGEMLGVLHMVKTQ